MKISRGRLLLILGIVLVVVDQVIKVLVKTNMTLGESFNVFGDWFRIYSFLRIGLFAAIVWWVSRLLKRPGTPTGVVVGLTMIAAGAMGNIIDCYFYGLIFSESTPWQVAYLGGSYAPFMFGKVVDMFYFPIIDTQFPGWMPLIGGDPFRFFAPVFNFADSCVTCGALYLIAFQYRFFMTEDSSASVTADGDSRPGKAPKKRASKK